MKLRIMLINEILVNAVHQLYKIKPPLAKEFIKEYMKLWHTEYYILQIFYKYLHRDSSILCTTFNWSMSSYGFTFWVEISSKMSKVKKNKKIIIKRL